MYEYHACAARGSTNRQEDTPVWTRQDASSSAHVSIFTSPISETQLSHLKTNFCWESASHTSEEIIPVITHIHVGLCIPRVIANGVLKKPGSMSISRSNHQKKVVRKVQKPFDFHESSTVETWYLFPFPCHVPR